MLKNLKNSEKIRKKSEKNPEKFGKLQKSLEKIPSSILTLALVGLLIAGLLAGLRMLIFSVPPQIPSSFGGEATGGTGVEPVLMTPELVGHQVGDLGRFVITQITFVLQTQVNCPIVPV